MTVGTTACEPGGPVPDCGVAGGTGRCLAMSLGAPLPSGTSLRQTARVASERDGCRNRARSLCQGVCGWGGARLPSCSIAQALVELGPKDVALSNCRSPSKRSALGLSTQSSGESSTLLATVSLAELNTLSI